VKTGYSEAAHVQGYRLQARSSRVNEDVTVNPRVLDGGVALRVIGTLLILGIISMIVIGILGPYEAGWLYGYWRLLAAIMMILLSGDNGAFRQKVFSREGKVSK
jgi:hypothetical protein